MRRALKLSAVVASVLAAATASMAYANASSDHDGVEVIQATRTTVEETFLDLDHSGGPTLGDQQVFSADFFMDGRKIGFDGGTCTLVRTPETYQCVATNSLPRGGFSVQGLLDFSRGEGPYTLAITGGTRAYRLARGEVEVILREPNDSVTFRIDTGERD